MRITTVTPIWGRKEITKIWLDYWLSVPSIYPVLVGHRHDLPYTTGDFCFLEHDNKRLAPKWQAGLGIAKRTEPDFVMEVGSDDFATPQLVEHLCELAATLDCVGILDYYMLDLLSGKCILWPGYETGRKGTTLGAFRVFSKGLLDEMNWVLWDSSEGDRANDQESDKRLNEAGRHIHGIRMSGDKIGFSPKSLNVINNIGSFQGREFDRQVVLRHFGATGEAIETLVGSSIK